MPLLASLGLVSAKGYGFTNVGIVIPVNSVAPVVSGTAQNRQTLSTTTGTWTGPPTSYSYQWKRGGTSISGATSSSYTLVTADVGSTITCTVTATNSAGSGNATSSPTATVSANTPLAPTIGTATATGTTTATVAYTAPADNGGATITSYTATSSPSGITGTLSTAGSGTITVSGLASGTSYTFTVKATNSVGASSASSSSNSITTTAAPPVNTSAPTVSGTPQVGFYYATTNGSWTNSPTSYTYQWYNAGTNTPLAGQTSQNFNPGTGSTYVGITLKCQVTASNSGGSASAFSNTSPAVIPGVPGDATAGTATATGSTTATVTFTAPAYDGGATITSYEAKNNLGTIVGTYTGSGSGTINCTGLSPSTTYNFYVRAINSAGAGPWSYSPTNTITTNAPTMSIALTSGTSPYVTAYPWSNSTGFGTKFSNPASAASGIGAYRNMFNSAGTYYVQDAFAGDNVDVWAWSNSTGFGTKVSAPSTLPANYGYAAAFNAAGTAIGVGTSGSPYIQIYPFSSGTFGAKYANPTTAATSGGPTSVAFSPLGTEVVLTGDTYPSIQAWTFSVASGFGAKLSVPFYTQQTREAKFTSAGATSAGTIALATWTGQVGLVYPWSSSGFGTMYTGPSTIPATGYGVAWTSDGTNIAFGSATSPYMSAYQFTPNGSTGYGTKYTNPATTPTGTAYGVTFTGVNAGLVFAHATSPYVTGYPFSQANAPVYGTGIGVKFSNPATLPPATSTNVAIAIT